MTAPRPGLAESLAIWGLAGTVGAAVFVTGSRLGGDGPPNWTVGRSHFLAYLGHPVAPAAIGLAGITAARLGPRDTSLGVASALVGGVSGALMLDGLRRPESNPRDLASCTIAGAAAGLTTAALARSGPGGFAAPPRYDGLRQVLIAAIASGALPWFLADVGIYAGDVPGLRRLVLSRDTPIAPGQIAVHLGHHHGMDGALLALTGLALSRQLPNLAAGRPRQALSLYLATLAVYGASRWLEDVWNEQVVKRGLARRKPPVVVRAGRPEGRGAWLAIGGLSWLVHRRWFEAEASAPRWSRLWFRARLKPRLATVQRARLVAKPTALGPHNLGSAGSPLFAGPPAAGSVRASSIA